MVQLCMGCMEGLDDNLDLCPHCGYVRGTPPLEACHITPGTILAERYILGRVLGFGGFGVTYIGYDKILEKKIAVKEYLPGEFSTRMPGKTKLTIYTGDKKEQFLSGKEKFIDEARRLAKFQTVPEVIHVYDCFEENNTAYIIMEYLEGESLKQKLEREGTMTVEQALPIILDILHGLQAVHEEGILHRDIAPDNIYITAEGKTKLLDFGAARFATTTHSRSLTVLIKPGYAPEEQYRSRGDQGTWTDVYATAATFYRMITGMTPQDSMERSAKDNVKEPSRLGVNIGPNTEAALMNAMNIKIEERTQTARQFEQELLANVVTRIIVKKKKTDIGRWPLWIKVLSVIGAIGLGLFVALLMTGTIRFEQNRWSGIAVPEGRTRVPNLINEEMETAIQRGEEAKLTVLVYDKQYSDVIPANKVLSQNLKGGSVVDIDETLEIVISAGIETATVPNVRGMKEEEGVSRLKDAGFVVSSKEEIYRAAPGTIGWQSLEGGSNADTGTTVDIIISMGLEGGDASKIEIVDDICGMDYEIAADKMADKYLYLLTTDTEYSTQIPKGAVIRQSVQAGTRLSQNSNIEVVVSLGPETVTIPDVQYKSQDEAVNMLETVGLKVEIIQEASATVPVGNVIRQNQNPGEQAAKETTVVVYISTGAPQRREEGRNTENRAPAAAQPAPETAPVVQETQPPAPSADQTSNIWDIIGN